jgi:hypothetical protein
VQNEIRNDYRWIDALIMRCLEVGPARRFADAGRLLAAIEACELGEDLPPLDAPKDMTPGVTEAGPQPPSARARAEESDALFREVRQLLAKRAFDQVIDRLDIHRPAEWAVVDLLGTRTLRALGQAYLGLGNLVAARDCLEQLRTAQEEQELLSRPDYAAAMSDLVRCYRGLGLLELAQACQEEVRKLL